MKDSEIGKLLCVDLVGKRLATKPFGVCTNNLDMLSPCSTEKTKVKKRVLIFFMQRNNSGGDNVKSPIFTASFSDYESFSKYLVNKYSLLKKVNQIYIYEDRYLSIFFFNITNFCRTAHILSYINHKFTTFLTSLTSALSLTHIPPSNPL